MKKHTESIAGEPVRIELDEYDLPVYSSLNQCSAATGIPISILKQSKNAGCPAFDRGNRVYLRKFLSWAFIQKKTGKIDWRGVLVMAKAQREELRLAKDRKQVMDFLEVKRQFAEAVGYLYSEHQRLRRELPAVCAGMNALALDTKFGEGLDGAWDRARKKFESIVEEPMEQERKEAA